MVVKSIGIDTLIDNYMITTQGIYVAIYITPQLVSTMKKVFNLSVIPFQLNMWRFNSPQEATSFYNILIQKVRPTLWINGVKQ